MSKHLLITLFCDASFCEFTKAAGWGAWAKMDGWPKGKLFGGTFKDYMSKSSDAEICAIANSFSYLEGDLKKCGAMMIQSDCIRALQLIHLRMPHSRITHHKDSARIHAIHETVLSEREHQALAAIEAIKGQAQISLLLRHVKGHRKGKGRSWVNQQCDAIARKHMQKMRDNKEYVYRKLEHFRKEGD